MANYATEKQLNFVASLMKDKDISGLPQAQQDFLNTPNYLARLAGIDTKRVSNVIQALLDCPTKRKVEEAETAHVEHEAQVNEPVPDPGYYFILDPTDDTEKFFRVNKGKPDTRWENYTFLSVQASDVFYPIKSQSHRSAVFAEILKDPIGSMNEYGIRLGRCGVCNRTLTDVDSRLRGIGPICAAKLNFKEADEADIDLLNSLGLLNNE